MGFILGRDVLRVGCAVVRRQLLGKLNAAPSWFPQNEEMTLTGAGIQTVLRPVLERPSESCLHMCIGQEGLWSWTLSALGVVMVTKQVQLGLWHEEMGMVVMWSGCGNDFSNILGGTVETLSDVIFHSGPGCTSPNWIFSCEVWAKRMEATIIPRIMDQVLPRQSTTKWWMNKEPSEKQGVEIPGQNGANKSCNRWLLLASSKRQLVGRWINTLNQLDENCWKASRARWGMVTAWCELVESHTKLVQVLDLGCGSGPYLRYYLETSAVSKVVMLVPWIRDSLA